jgi:hypothetical protein
MAVTLLAVPMTKLFATLMFWASVTVTVTGSCAPGCALAQVGSTTTRMVPPGS